MAASTPPRFPFSEPRRHQDLLLRDVDDAARSGLLLLCSAPTGIGKTVAVLCPLLERAAVDDRKLFVTTARVSQQQLALETLGRMLGSGECALQIRARERSCPLDGRVCRDGACSYRDRVHERLAASGLVGELCELGVVDGGAVERAALEQGLCPFEVSLEVARAARAVVCDYNYVFDPSVSLRGFFDRARPRHLLVVDEAHNLPARARDYWSPVLVPSRLAEAAALCRMRRDSLLRDVAALLEDAAERCISAGRALEEERGEPGPWPGEPDRTRFAELLDRTSELLPEVHARGGVGAGGGVGDRGRSRDPALAALEAVRDYGRACAEDPERFAGIYDADRAQLLCLDAAPWLRGRFESFHAVVCMSATLTPFAFHRSVLGADGPRTVELELGSPFPAENRLLLSVTSVDTTFRRRSEHAPEIAALIARSTALRRGNYLAFFPSFAFRDEVLRHLQVPGLKVVSQHPAMPTQLVLQLLRANRSRPLLLCAVHGGVFAEGVDYPGEMACGVFVVGPGLPAVSPEQELLREYYDRTRGAGFEFAYLDPGMVRSIQAGGRAIRTPEDRGFVMLIGRRFAEPPYLERLPAEWRERMVRVEDPVEAIERFWKEGARI